MEYAMYQRHGKRIFDLMITIPLLVILAPLFVVLIVLVRSKLGTPVFFRQTRPGLKGQPFELLKFRTMTDARDAQGQLLSDEERMHPFGMWLRSTSLDELPGLLLVLSGKLSLVGPRPLLMSYLPRYTSEQMRRHDALPGITGWAQVNGRNAIGWEQKFALDVWYVDHQSFRLDLQILWMTFWKVLHRDGINQAGRATVEEFQGSLTP
jgi:sugar transferase EpsL